MGLIYFYLLFFSAKVVGLPTMYAINCSAVERTPSKQVRTMHRSYFYVVSEASIYLSVVCWWHIFETVETSQRLCFAILELSFCMTAVSELLLLVCTV